MISQTEDPAQSDRLAAALTYAHRGDVQPPTDTPEALKTALIDIGLSALESGDWSTTQLITICLQGGGLRHV
jgi:hypothetical protein